MRHKGERVRSALAAAMTSYRQLPVYSPDPALLVEGQGLVAGKAARMLEEPEAERGPPLATISVRA